MSSIIIFVFILKFTFNIYNIFSYIQLKKSNLCNICHSVKQQNNYKKKSKFLPFFDYL